VRGSSGRRVIRGATRAGMGPLSAPVGGSGRERPRSIPEAPPDSGCRAHAALACPRTRLAGRRSGPVRGGSRGRRPIEGDAAVAERDVRIVADHEVVEQGDVQQASGGEGLGGEVQVVR
jgi:hypothetical protein